MEVPFGTDLLFAADDVPGFVVRAEICEDYWAPTPPFTAGALAGAQLVRTSCAYVYSAVGPDPARSGTIHAASAIGL